jgi:hypothetical protein
MFNETSYSVLSDTVIPAWQAAGFASKAEWKQAGGRAALTAGVPLAPGQTFIPPPGLPTIPGPAGSTPGQVTPVDSTGAAVPGPASTGQQGGLGSLFSSIPSSYLLIGAVIIGIMVLKK